MSKISNITDVLSNRAFYINEKHVSLKDTVNDDSNSSYNDNDNDGGKEKYAFNPSGPAPQSAETVLAYEIAQQLDDLDNYAFYVKHVTRRGCGKSQELFQRLTDMINHPAPGSNPIRDKRRYFSWMIRNI